MTEVDRNREWEYILKTAVPTAEEARISSRMGEVWLVVECIKKATENGRQECYIPLEKLMKRTISHLYSKNYSVENYESDRGEIYMKISWEKDK